MIRLTSGAAEALGEGLEAVGRNCARSLLATGKYGIFGAIGCKPCEVPAGGGTGAASTGPAVTVGAGTGPAVTVGAGGAIDGATGAKGSIGAGAGVVSALARGWTGNGIGAGDATALA